MLVLIVILYPLLYGPVLLNVFTGSILYKLLSSVYKDLTFSPSNAIPTNHPDSYHASDIV